jgi:hypothetical protein
MGVILAAGVAGAFAAVGASPADKADARAQVLRTLMDCRQIAAADARLACFDKASADLDRAEASGDVVVVDRQQARAARRQAFGLNLSALSIFDRGVPKEEIDTLADEVRAARQNADGKWVVSLKSGAVWRQIDDAMLYPEPHAGSSVRIHRASLGSYMMNVDRQPAIKVHRDE